MKKFLYVLCKIGNWLIPFIILGSFSKIDDSYIFYVTIGYALFIILWFMYSTSRSRLLYQSPIFIGYLIGMFNIFTSDDTTFEKLLGCSSENVTVGEKIIMTAFCIIAFVCKIYTMAYETKDYNKGATRRHNNRLDDKISAATYELEHARNAEDRQRAEARLERAKLDKERYKIDE